MVWIETGTRISYDDFDTATCTMFHLQVNLFRWVTIASMDHSVGQRFLYRQSDLLPFLFRNFQPRERCGDPIGKLRDRMRLSRYTKIEHFAKMPSVGSVMVM